MFTDCASLGFSLLPSKPPYVWNDRQNMWLWNRYLPLKHVKLQNILELYLILKGFRIISDELIMIVTRRCIVKYGSVRKKKNARTNHTCIKLPQLINLGAWTVQQITLCIIDIIYHISYLYFLKHTYPVLIFMGDQWHYDMHMKMGGTLIASRYCN